jgi:TATA-box binding protein (TBP) (component of TFIID and TFIIIB)
MLENIDVAWDDFLANKNSTIDSFISKKIPQQNSPKILPKCSDIYISTKTKISYLNQIINLSDVFWKIPIMEYGTPMEGAIKKQMKFNSATQEELDNITKKINDDSYVDQYLITHIVNPKGRIKFKDVRKISIGLSKKDLISYRCKKKSAFYNCFVIILRINHKNAFREIHVKVFNTGKLEIPGIQSEEILTQVLDLLIKVLSPLIENSDTSPLSYLINKNETVLINSNFNCGFYINRDALYDLLKYKYKINSGYDPCSYPGIQSLFYYNSEIEKQTGQPPIEKHDKIHKMSFMIFRTGSVLIVGKCEEDMLNEIYQFIKKLLQTEYPTIGEQTVDHTKQKEKKKKIRKKTIIINHLLD